MAEVTYNLVVLDYVEDAEWDGKKYLRLMDKGGNEWRLGQHLAQKYAWVRSLPSGTTVKLTMDTFIKDGESKDFVRDIEKASDVLMKQNANKLVQRNPKFITEEAQVAVKATVDLLVNKIEVPQDIQDMAFTWIKNSLKSATEESK